MSRKNQKAREKRMEKAGLDISKDKIAEEEIVEEAEEILEEDSELETDDEIVEDVDEDADDLSDDEEMFDELGMFDEEDKKSLRTKKADKNKKDKKPAKVRERKERKVPDLKPKKIYLTASFLIIIAAVIVYLVFGLAPSKENTGFRVYTTTIDDYFAQESLPLFEEDISKAAGVPVKVVVTDSALEYKSVIEITTRPDESIDETAVLDMLAAEYPFFDVESFEQYVYGPVFTWKNILTLSIIFLVALLVLFIITGILLNGKDGFVIITGMLHDTVIMAALYVICRVPAPRALIPALLISWTASVYFNVNKTAALSAHYKDSKKKSAMTTINTITALDVVITTDKLVAAALFLTAFTVVGIVMESMLLAYFGVMVFAALAVALYSSTFLVPNLWAGGKKK